MQSVKRRLESLVSSAGLSATTRFRLPGRALLPPGVDGAVVSAMVGSDWRLNVERGLRSAGGRGNGRGGILWLWQAWSHKCIGHLPLAHCKQLTAGLLANPPSQVPIYDAEPSSIIAHALCTHQYLQLLNAAIKAVIAEIRQRAPEAAAWLPGGPMLLQHQQQLHSKSGPTQQLLGGAGMLPVYPGSGGGAVGSGAPPMGSGLSSSASVPISFAGAGAFLQPSAGAGSAGPSAGGGLPGSEPAGGSAGGAPGGQGAGTAPGAGAAAASSTAAAAAAAAAAAVAGDGAWLQLLLSREPAHVKLTFEDRPSGMPWANAKFEVGERPRAVNGRVVHIV